VAPGTEASAGLDPYQAFAELVGLKLAHMAESIDDIRAQNKQQIEAEAKRLRIYEERWQIDHDGLTELVAELRGVRRDLEAWVSRCRRSSTASTIYSVSRDGRTLLSPR